MCRMKIIFRFILLLVANQNFVPVSASSDKTMDILLGKVLEEQCVSYCNRKVQPELESIGLGEQILKLFNKLEDLSRIEQKIDIIIQNQEEEQKARKSMNEMTIKDISNSLDEVIKTLSENENGSGSGSDILDQALKPLSESEYDSGCGSGSGSGNGSGSGSDILDQILKPISESEDGSRSRSDAFDDNEKRVSVPQPEESEDGSGSGSDDNEKKSQTSNSKSNLIGKDTLIDDEDISIELLNIEPKNCLPFGDSSGIHTIQIPEIGSYKVRCNSNAAGNGWLVIQRRFNGEESFYRNWKDYKDGFGQLSGEFWLGLEKLYQLTKHQQYELLVNMISHDGQTHFARYNDFHIGSESEDYELKSLGEFSGTDTEKFEYNLHQKFTTLDHPNDDWQGHCAEDRYSGWWHAFCTHVNPNGKYYTDEVEDKNSMHWFNDISLMAIEMLIRPKYP